ncbi:MAG TPA: hypothetical protein VMX17_04845 [Candidatus Glassbacteria bacterium]|nr:hypothetical protein [Candidatus Glassbacteria bacterium]
MGNCKYCGKPAGLLKGKHKECEIQFLEKQKLLEKGRQEILTLVSTTIIGTENYDNIESKIAEIEDRSSLQPDERKVLLVKGWEMAIDHFLNDGVLDEVEEQRLTAFSEKFQLTQNDLDKDGAYTKIIKAAILRDILKGEIPERIKIEGNFNINFQKTEKIVWVFRGCKYLEDKTQRTYQRGSRGASLKIMKGVYLHPGACKGQSVTSTIRVHIDTGSMIITNKNIYFEGQKKTFKLPYNKIMSFEPYSDGVGVLKDTATAKMQSFITGDGWFAYNLVANLAKM